MSSGRSRVRGDVPENIYVVSYGTHHKIYSSKQAAKQVRTNELNQRRRYRKDISDDSIRIFEIANNNKIIWEEIDYA